MGSRFLIYKQDPLVTELGTRAILIPAVVLNGPADTRITTRLPGTTPVARDTKGDFLFRPDTPEFDCAHTFAVTRATLTMVERHHGGPVPFAWNSGGETTPVTVFPRAGTGANAFYSRTAKALKFLHFTPEGETTEVFTCRSLDIVAHETGHAILDGLKPGWLANDNPPQTGGLHESWGDLCAIFLALSQPDQAESLITLTKGNLHAKSFLPALAEQFGTALGLPFGLRNADNDLKLSEVGNEVHAISQVFTGGIYDTLADIFAFEYRRRRHEESPTLVLIDTAHRLCELVFQGLLAAPGSCATYTEVVQAMLRLSAERGDPAIYRTLIRNRFALREVISSPTPIGDLLSGRMDLSDPGYTGGDTSEDTTEVTVADERSASILARQDRSSCCGTLQLPEFQTMTAERLGTQHRLSDDDILASELADLSRAFT